MDRLVGSANEVDVTIEDRSTTCLLDSGSMFSTISDTLCADLDLPVQPLNALLEVEGVGGHNLPYRGYTVANLTFPGVSPDPIEALLLVVPETSYHRRVPLLIGTNILQEILCRTGTLSSTDVPSVWHLALGSVHAYNNARDRDSLGDVVCTKDTVIPPDSRVLVHGFTRVKAGSCRLSVITERKPDKSLPGGLLLTPGFAELKPGATRVGVEVVNLSSKPVTVPRKTTICQLQTATIAAIDVGDDSAQSSEKNVSSVPKGLDDEQFLAIFANDLEKTLSVKQQCEVQQFLLNWKHLFSLHDLDLGLTNLTEHKITLMDDTPFKERHRRIPPSMIDEVRSHLKQMLDLGVIQPSQSPFSSGVVLVRKKDGSLRFCIELRRLNTVTVKDAHALPRIDVSLDSLSGSRWFSSLDLHSAYWQVGITEEDHHKKAFSVGCLGFYECLKTPFGCTNTPATFQRLMETCMGDLYFKYCLLYLDDIVVFSRTYEEHIERL